MFEGNSYEDILNRMLNRLSNDIDKREGSVVRDLISPKAIELSDVYFKLENMLSYVFLNENTPSDYLERKTAEFGVNRLKATKSFGAVKFIGNSDEIVIPQGQVFFTEKPDGEIVRLETIETAKTVNLEAIVNCQSITTGKVSNIDFSDIIKLEVPINGIESVEVETPFIGGFDDETDEALLVRYFEKIQKPITSGNANQYEAWAKEVNGVGTAKCTPLWNGNGTVKVTISNTDNDVPDQFLIDNVENYILSVKPIGADLTVDGVVRHDINVSVKVKISDNYILNDIRDSFEDRIKDYFKTIPFNGLVSVAKIGVQLLSVDGVVDYEDLFLNGEDKNIDLQSVSLTGKMTIPYLTALNIVAITE